MNNILPQGAIYIENFIISEEQSHLEVCLDKREWSNALKRRVQHIGYIYDYKTRKIDQSHSIGKIPYFLKSYANKLAEDQSLLKTPDQIIANEYLPGQGISRHLDCEPCFEETIASLSLLSSCEMIFRSRDGQKKSIVLQPRSLLILTGESRYFWTHEIPARKSDIVNGDKQQRSRRISLTFRNVIL